MYKLFRFTLLFFFIFDISFTFFPISTGKLATAIFCVIFVARKGVSYIKSQTMYVSIFYVVFCLVLIYNLILFLFNNPSDSITLSRLIYFSIYCLGMSYVIPSFYYDIYDFLQSIGYVVTVQGIFIIISWLSTPYRQFLESIVNNTGNISFLSDKRPPGLMSSAGAGASVILGLGSALIIYLVLNSKTKKNYLNILCFVISFVATFIVGRTGLILGSTLILFLILSSISKLEKFVKVILGIPLVLSLFFLFFDRLKELLPEQFSSKIEWVFGEFSTGLLTGNTANALRNMTIKPLTIDTLIGTSRIRLEGGNHDSGYIQNYHSMGLICVFIFYFLLVYYCVILFLENKSKIWIQQNKFFILLLCVGMFSVEIKEPFIFYYFFPWMVFSILKLSDKRTSFIKENP